MDARRRRELAAFLRSRRQRVDPSAHGLDAGRRRAPGLRREEVAAIAGVSLSWYTWLEQARDIRASADVFASIARALFLDPTEREYILRLGGHAPEAAQPADRPDASANLRLQALTKAFLPNPASVITPCFDYVAWNRASERIVPGFLGCGEGTYNLARFLFCGGADRSPVRGPQEGPKSWVARLRMNAARHPTDRRIAGLVEELSDVSPEFARLWRLHDVRPAGPFRELRLEHPEAGSLTFREIDLTPDDFPELTLVVFLPADETTIAGLGAISN